MPKGIQYCKKKKPLSMQCTQPQGLGNPKASDEHWPCMDTAKTGKAR